MINFILFWCIIISLYFSFVDFADAKDTRSIIWAILGFLLITIFLNRILI